MKRKGGREKVTMPNTLAHYDTTKITVANILGFRNQKVIIFNQDWVIVR